MIREYKLYQVDAFTRKKFAGNPAGVISNADGLSEIEMQKIARELNNSETAFIFTSENDAYDVHVRFFTPTKEVPICGHATVSAHYVRAIENNLGSVRVIQKTGAGILPVDIDKENEDYCITMTQGRIEFGDILDRHQRMQLAAALHITENDLEMRCPIQIVSTGHSKVMIGIKSSQLLNRLNPDYSALAALSGEIRCNGFYVFTFDSDEPDILVRGRMFAPAIGINEDPVTGNANGPLGAYLIHHRLVNHDGHYYTFKIKQGEAIGRTGTMMVHVKIENEQPVEVKISGYAVIAFQSKLVL